MGKAGQSVNIARRPKITVVGRVGLYTLFFEILVVFFYVACYTPCLYTMKWCIKYS